MIRSFAELTPEDLLAAGGKGGSLARLAQAGYPVPEGFVVLPSAFDDGDLKPEAWAESQAAVAQLRGSNENTAFAVRSSALAEDSAQASFAGEFETVLNVYTDDAIRRAIDSVHDSRHAERVHAYSRHRGMNEEHEIAIVVQKLVLAECSGVLFTADPVSGRRDRVVISAAWGLGESVVGGTVTPDTLTVDKATGRVLRRATADKRVMTVRLASGTAEQAVPDARRRAPVLADEQAAELARLGAGIEELYGRPMDVEWARAAGRFAILQARPVTALPSAQTAQTDLDTPSAWKLPRGMYAAMRNNIVELMADPLTPLFGTFGRAAINRSLSRLLAGFFGRQGIMPEEIIALVNGYAYFNGSLSPRHMVRLLAGSIGTARRMFTGAVERWTEAGRPRYMEAVERWESAAWRDLPATGLLAAAGQVMEAAIDAYGALVSGVIPAAWISEAMFTAFYNTLVRRRADPPAAAYLLGFDSEPIAAEKALFDLAQWIRSQPGLAAHVADRPGSRLAEELRAGVTPPDVDEEAWSDWVRRFGAHLQSHGHLIYSLDFADPVPADDPAPLLETCRLFVGGRGADPYARQQVTAASREQATQTILGRLKGARLKLFRKLLVRAQRYAPLREDGLAAVGWGYPILRQMLLELGRRLAEQGMIAEPGDVFWLIGEEAEYAAARLDSGEAPVALPGVVAQRKAGWRAARRATPPTRLPDVTVPGLAALKRLGAARHERGGNVLKGTAASPGRVTGPARVVRGPEDFGQMQPGEVLVAAITTPAWTPLFARAAAVVTDVGGPLSHGSIVAREYGIPAVLGTGTATKRVHSGQMLTVDGSSGVVTMAKNGSPAR